MKARSYTTVTTNGSFTTHSWKGNRDSLIFTVVNNIDHLKDSISIWMSNKELQELHEQIGNYLRLKKSK